MFDLIFHIMHMKRGREKGKIIFATGTEFFQSD